MAETTYLVLIVLHWSDTCLPCSTCFEVRICLVDGKVQIKTRSFAGGVYLVVTSTLHLTPCLHRLHRLYSIFYSSGESTDTSSLLLTI